MNAPVQQVQQPKKKNQRSDNTNTPVECRIAHVYLHRMRTKNAAGVLFTQKDGTPNPRHSMVVMFPKTNRDANQCSNYLFLWGLACQAAQRMWPQSVNQAGQWIWPEGAKLDVQDGDIPYRKKIKPGEPAMPEEEVQKRNAWRVGYWIIETEMNPALQSKPTVSKFSNGQVQDVIADTVNGVVQYKSGDWGIPNIHAWAYENENFGVNFGFDGVCFTREGERIGGTGQRTAQQMFGNLGGMPGLQGMPAVSAAPGVAGPSTMAPLAPPPAAPQPQYAPQAAAVAAPIAAPPPPPPALNMAQLQPAHVHAAPPPPLAPVGHAHNPGVAMPPLPPAAAAAPQPQYAQPAGLPPIPTR